MRSNTFTSRTLNAFGPINRRGVASVLAMMFLVIFGSLAAAMAVVAQGNLRTADSGMKLSRAMSAAETGLVFAQRRLASEAQRFVVEKGVIDGPFGEDIWKGTYDEGSDGAVTVLPPTGYPAPSTPPSGVMEAVRDAHDADTHSFNATSGDSSLPSMNTTTGELRVKPIRLNDEDNPPYFRLTYSLVDDAPYVHVTSEGVAGDIRRTIEMDFKIDKKIEFAILSPNRIMIGKNVLVEGPLGSRYGLVTGELEPENGDPLVMRSDFYYLADALNTKLDNFYAQVVQYDVDGDNRLRPDHPDEGDGVSGQPDLVDYDGDEYVDAFDLFMAHFDTNGDERICYRADAGSVEFSVDNQLAVLIDQSNADRDGDGDYGTASDTGLGYNDGILDVNDMYAKVTGKLCFAAAQNDWETPHGGSYRTVVEGAVRPDLEVPPVSFEVTEDEMREITTDMFSESETWFESQAVAGSFAAQTASGGTYTPPSGATWEAVPFGSEGAYDYYQRPQYSGYTFTNVRIPKGTNALFTNCTFVGVTYIEAEEDCDHYNWNYTGAVEKKEVPPGSGNWTYPLRFPGLNVDSPSAITDTKVHSNNIRFHNCTFLGSVSGDRPNEYTHWRNKLQYTGNTRFYIDPAEPELNDTDHPDYQADASTLRTTLNGMDEDDREELEKSSILMPGWSIDVGSFSNEAGPKVKLKGTIVAGILDVRGTVDVHGTMLMTFRPTEAQGPLYYGGLTDAFNTTIGYFGPLDGDGEGVDPDDASFTGFGEITLRYNPDAKLPDGIPWPIRIDADPTTYVE